MSKSKGSRKSNTKHQNKNPNVGATTRSKAKSIDHDAAFIESDKYSSDSENGCGSPSRPTINDVLISTLQGSPSKAASSSPHDGVKELADLTKLGSLMAAANRPPHTPPSAGVIGDSQPVPIALIKPTTSSPWKALFEHSEREKGLPLSFVSPLVHDGSCIASVDVEEVQQLVSMWDKELAFYVIGASP